MRKLWKWWLAGGVNEGVKGKKFILLDIILIPFMTWLSSDRDVSLLYFMVISLLLFVVFCLWCSVSLFFRHYYGKK